LTARDFFGDSSGTVRPPWRVAIFAASTVASVTSVPVVALPGVFLGGVWGPEGGVGAALGLVPATIYLYLRHRRREES